MSDGFWRRLETLFHEALARPEAERAAFIAKACGTDLALKRELESLLAQSSATGFLDGAVLHSSSNESTQTSDGHMAARSSDIRVEGYRIVGRLGAGGMGEVFRARDNRLARDVAVKILPADLATDAARLARFEREARVLASLNHPHIGAIYGIEDVTGPGHSGPALILELVEGETLAERLAGGALPVAEAIRIAVIVADALEAAHDRGIVHRDLKPANIKLTPDGIAKVLDFGLATAAGHADVAPDVDTLLPDKTAVGSILGTAPYMSPEQARGEPVDKRTDVWALGCVLYEMLTGSRAFSGKTTGDTIAHILTGEVDWNRLPADTPQTVRRLLVRMLTKPVRHRLRDIGDARLELEDAARGDLAQLPPSTRTSSVLRPLAISGWVLAIALGLWLLLAARLRPTLSTSPPPQPLIAMSIAVGPEESYARDIAVSPDGAYIAYVAGPPGDHRTYLRSLAQRQSRALTTVPAEMSYPFFSPDSQWLAFFDAGKLKKVSVSGGAPITLADAPVPRGGTWAANGAIVFSPAARSGLVTVPAAGGRTEPFSNLEEGSGDTSHRNPAWIAGTDTIIYTAEGDTYAKRKILVTSIGSRQTHVVLEANAERVKYAPSGHLLFLDAGKLIAAPFDVASMAITGPPSTMLEDVGTFAFSSSGLLVFGRTDSVASGAELCTVVWVDRNGREDVLLAQPQGYLHPRLSPDGTRLLIQVVKGTDRSLWVHDLGKDLVRRFTFEGANGWPLWTPDGRVVVYAANRPGTQWDILAAPADGTGAPSIVLGRPLTQFPATVSPDGSQIVFGETDPNRGDTLWTVPLRGGSDPKPFLDNTPGEMMPSFSPDGRWIAYVSRESGRNEVYVRGTNGAAGKWQVSDTDGVEPVWSPLGNELFYRSHDTMLAVDVKTTPVFSFAKARKLFEGSYGFGINEAQAYDVGRDARRFIMLKPQEHPRDARPLDAFVNWFDDLKRRVPPGGARSTVQRSVPDGGVLAMVR